MRAEEAPAVEAIKVDNAPPTQVLTLPGETRGWYMFTIYARVSGYVANSRSGIDWRRGRCLPER